MQCVLIIVIPFFNFSQMLTTLLHIQRHVHVFPVVPFQLTKSSLHWLTAPARGLPYIMVQRAGVKPLKKTGLPFPSDNRMPVVGSRTSCPIPVLHTGNFVWLDFAQVLCVLSRLLWFIYASALLYPESTAALEPSNISSFYNLYPSSSSLISEP